MSEDTHNASPTPTPTCSQCDRLRAALLGVAHHIYVTGQSCWCNGWELDPEHFHPHLHQAYCLVAAELAVPLRAPSGVSDAPAAPCSSCVSLRADIDRLAALVLEVRAERQQARSACDAACLERDAFRTQLADARSALARIRNVATAAHAPLAQCLDWCANEAVLALDRIAPHAPSGSSNAPVAPCPRCAVLSTAIEAARPILKHAAVDGSPDALAALDLVADALAPAPLGTSAVPGTTPPHY